MGCKPGPEASALRDENGMLISAKRSSWAHQRAKTELISRHLSEYRDLVEEHYKIYDELREAGEL